MEFSLIEQYFQTPFQPLAKAMAGKTLTGLGDDCFNLNLAEHETLFVSTDTLVAGVHFFADGGPSHIEHLGYKALAVNVSDLAASGATPIAFSLNLSLPSYALNEQVFNMPVFCESFSKGLLHAAQTFHCALLGGDTTSLPSGMGPVIGITAYGVAPKGHLGFHRAHARVGDALWLSGVPGLALLGLLLEFRQRDNAAAMAQYAEKIFILQGACLQVQSFSKAAIAPISSVAPAKPQALEALLDVLENIPENVAAQALKALHRPSPRLDVAQALMRSLHCQRGGECAPAQYSIAAIDLSDGLSGDLLHIARLSQCGIGLSPAALQAIWLECWPECTPWLPWLLPIALLGGDDYQLAFTMPKHDVEQVDQLDCALPQDCRVVGTIEAVGKVVPKAGVFLQGANGRRYDLPTLSHQHFDSPNINPIAS